MRDSSIDFLRSIIILNAFVLHLNSKIGLGIVAYPSRIIQGFIFSVGAVFFYLSGYFSRTIYYSKYEQNPKLLSCQLLIKGIQIILLYFLYVYSMHIITNSALPDGFINFTFHHEFFTKVLFTFGVLFIITPVYLYLYKNVISVLYFGLLVIFVVVVCYNTSWDISSLFKIVFFDRKLFFYPLLPSILIYSAGFFISDLELRGKFSFYTLTSFWIAVIALSAHLTACYLFTDYKFLVIKNRQIYTLIEMITPLMAIIVIKHLFKVRLFAELCKSKYSICIGIYSLHFYVISNMLIGLLQIRNDNDRLDKILTFFVIASLSYLCTLWKFESNALSRNYRLE